MGNAGRLGIFCFPEMVALRTSSIEPAEGHPSGLVDTDWGGLVESP